MRQCRPLPAGTPDANVLTRQDMQAMEYNNLIQALKFCHGKVFGADGAAAMLRVKPTTLASRIKRFGIDTRMFKPKHAAVPDND